jgi:hypothetical protein
MLPPSSGSKVIIVHVFIEFGAEKGQGLVSISGRQGDKEMLSNLIFPLHCTCTGPQPFPRASFGQKSYIYTRTLTHPTRFKFENGGNLSISTWRKT